MNLLYLILIILIAIIESFISFIFNNGLLFIKPANLSKTELVEKFKELSSSKSLENLKNKNTKDINKKDEDELTIMKLFKSYYSSLSNFIFKINNLITKIVLFAILMKYFRKIRLMKFIIRIINYIFLSTFSIFITDIYGLKEIIIQIEYY
jgi:hypothetical protein